MGRQTLLKVSLNLELRRKTSVICYATPQSLMVMGSGSLRPELAGSNRREIVVRGQSYFSRLPKYWPSIPLSARRVCPPPATHSPGGEGDGGSIFWKTREIGLPSYNDLSTGLTGSYLTLPRQPRRSGGGGRVGTVPIFRWRCEWRQEIDSVTTARDL